MRPHLAPAERPLTLDEMRRVERLTAAKSELSQELRDTALFLLVCPLVVVLTTIQFPSSKALLAIRNGLIMLFGLAALAAWIAHLVVRPRRP